PPDGEATDQAFEAWLAVSLRGGGDRCQRWAEQSEEAERERDGDEHDVHRGHHQRACVEAEERRDRGPGCAQRWHCPEHRALRGGCASSRWWTRGGSPARLPESTRGHLFGGRGSESRERWCVVTVSKRDRIRHQEIKR